MAAWTGRLSRATSSSRWADHGFRCRQDRPRPQCGQPVGFAVHEPGDAAPQLVPGLPDTGQFFRDIRNYPLGGIGGGGGAEVGHVVEDRPVRLVADRAHHGRRGVGDGPDEFLIAERQQVLQRAAAPGDNDHVDVGAGVELAQGCDDLGYGRVALDRHFPDFEFDGGPAERGVAHARLSWHRSRAR